MKEGFIKIQRQGIKAQYCQYKNDKKNGYGIVIWPSGLEHRGNFKDGKIDGYGFIKFLNNEHDGQWKNGFLRGEAVFKNSSTGRVERRFYKDDRVIEVLEVVEEGH
jgi:antitoxin component YwqK of YwqJK toxin-antitoxin module